MLALVTVHFIILIITDTIPLKGQGIIRILKEVIFLDQIPPL